MIMGEFFPHTAPGHGSVRPGFCNARGCNPQGSRGHLQDRTKVAERFVAGHTDRGVPRDESGEVSRETRFVGDSAILGVFRIGEKVRISLPYLNAKFGAGEAYPDGAKGVVVSPPLDVSPDESLVDVLLAKPWKRERRLPVPAALLEHV